MYMKLFSLFRNYQFLRYILVGSTNTLFSYGVYIFSIWLGIAYTYASLLSLMLGLLVSFFMQGCFVFGNPSAVNLIKFFLAWSLLYILNISIISWLINADFNAYMAGAIATIPVTFISYFVHKFAIFRKPTTPFLFTSSR